jgi:DNA polymerase sigma
MNAFPQIRPLFLVLKHMSCQYKLHEQKSGGIRTYTLFIMLLSFISKWGPTPPGKLLIDFLFYFSFYYDHYELKADEEDHCSIVLHIIDPLNPSIDLGTHALIQANI